MCSGGRGPVSGVSRHAAKPLGLVLLAGLVPALALADGDEAQLAQADATPLALDRVTITGGGAGVREIPGAAHQIGRGRLEDTGYTDPHQILREVPGVLTHEEEGSGLFPHISIRGTRGERNSRITVMEDGILAAPAPYAAPAAYYFPSMGRMDRVEVRKGSSAIQYGPRTTGGAVNMISTPVPESLRAEARLESGSHGGRRSHALVGDHDGQIGYLVEAWDQSSDGFRELDGPVGSGPEMPEPDTGFEVREQLGKLQWRPDTATPQEFELRLSRQDRTANETYLGLTDEDFDAQPLRRYAGSGLDQINTDQRQFSLAHQIEFQPDLRLATTVYNQEFARNWYKLHEAWDGERLDGEGDADFVGISAILDAPEEFAGEMDWIRGEGGDARGNLRANNREYYSRGVQTVLEQDFSLGDWSHQLEAGLRYHRDEEDRLQWQDSFRAEGNALVPVAPGSEPGAESGIPGSTTNRVTEAEAWAFHVQDRIRVGDWTLIPGLRYEDIAIERTDFREGEDPSRDEITDFQRNTNRVLLPGFGAVYQLDSATELFAGAHRGFSPVGPSPEVSEERSTNLEAGFRHRRNGGQLEAAAFFTDYSNLVGICTAASGEGCEVGEQFDGGDVDVYGLELSGRYDLARPLDTTLGFPVDIAYTRMESEFRTAFESNFSEWGSVAVGDELPQFPRNQLNLGLGVQGAQWQLRLGAHYASTARATAGAGSVPEAERIDSRWLFDVSADYRLSPAVQLFASVENATDETYRANRRPSGVRTGQPRSVWAGLRLRL